MPNPQPNRETSANILRDLDGELVRLLKYDDERMGYLRASGYKGVMLTLAKGATNEKLNISLGDISKAYNSLHAALNALIREITVGDQIVLDDETSRLYKALSSEVVELQVIEAGMEIGRLLAIKKLGENIQIKID